VIAATLTGPMHRRSHCCADSVKLKLRHLLPRHLPLPHAEFGDGSPSVTFFQAAAPVHSPFRPAAAPALSACSCPRTLLQPCCRLMLAGVTATCCSSPRPVGCCYRPEPTCSAAPKPCPPPTGMSWPICACHEGHAFVVVFHLPTLLCLQRRAGDCAPL
jgi:hypothetical protein